MNNQAFKVWGWISELYTDAAILVTVALRSAGSAAALRSLPKEHSRFLRKIPVFFASSSATSQMITSGNMRLAQKKRATVIQLTDATTAITAIRLLSYNKAPELFTMWLCLFAPLITGKQM